MMKGLQSVAHIL